MSAVNDNRLTRWLLAGGLVGPLLFIAVFLIEGATRPGYSVWRNYVSQLALSDQGWEQIANFLVCGLLCIGFAVGLRRIWRSGRASVWGPLLIGVFGLGLVVAGLFVTDPAMAYPPGTTLNSRVHTWHGTIHGINAIVVFPALTLACFVLARRFAIEPHNRGWASYSRITGGLNLVLFVLGNASAVLDEKGVLQAPTGLIQRAEIIIGWGWIALTALRLLRQEREAIVTDGRR